MSASPVPVAERAPLGLLRKMLAIMTECAYIQKDKENPHFRYRYASEAAIKEKVHTALVNHGVLFQCDCVTFEERIITKVNDKGKEITEALAKCQFHYSFTDVDTGEMREGTFFGTGVDAADKHLYKAVTGAIKYILTTTFLIPTGDDPENEKEETAADKKKKQKDVADRKLAEMQSKGATVRDVPATGGKIITEGQRKRLYALKGTATLTDDQCKLILGSYGFTSSTQVTVDSYEAICADITRCGEMNVHFPMPLDYKLGNHVCVQGQIYRLSDTDAWEEVTAK